MTSSAFDNTLSASSRAIDQRSPGPRELTFLEKSTSNADLARILLHKINSLESHIAGHPIAEPKEEPEASGLPYTLDTTNDRLRACLDAVERIHNRF